MADTMIVMYNLAEDQSESEFEQWLQDVDIPGYTKLKSMRNPAYYRASAPLGEGKAAPFKYTVVIEMDGPDAVEAEMDDPAWTSFIEDIESRIKDAHYVVASRIF
ncbi:MAG: hypothetical protein AAGJ54_08045 [Planctomycetota bacterium]